MAGRSSKNSNANFWDSEMLIGYINSDELVEITPSTYRMRKKILNTVDRKKYDARKRAEEKGQ